MQRHRSHSDEPAPFSGWIEKPPPATNIIDLEWCKITLVGTNGASQKSWKNKFTGNHRGFPVALRCALCRKIKEKIPTESGRDYVVH